MLDCHRNRYCFSSDSSLRFEDRVAKFPTEDIWIPVARVEGLVSAEFVRPVERPLDRAGERIPMRESHG